MRHNRCGWCHHIASAHTLTETGTVRCGRRLPTGAPCGCSGFLAADDFVAIAERAASHPRRWS